jgi:hypothetical protein
MMLAGFSSEGFMGYKSLALAFILVSTAAYAKEPKAYQTGKQLQMDSVQCGLERNSDPGFGNSLLGDSGHKRNREALCQEYLLQTDRLVYRIRPRDEKHATLLPVDGQAQFRLEKDRMLLRVEDSDSREHEYTVFSVGPREDGGENGPVRVNHLQ